METMDLGVFSDHYEAGMDTMDLNVFISFDDAGNANTAEWFAEATVKEGVMEVAKSNGFFESCMTDSCQH